MNRLFLAFAAVSVLAFSSCNKNRGPLGAAEGDYVGGTALPERIEGANFFGSNVNRGQFKPVYFGYDSYTVSDSELTNLGKVADSAKRFKNTIIIAGFTDDRGTAEYNRGLGERRAQAVRSSLIGLGIPGVRLQTVSFGKEMPADPGSGDAAYAKNRRAEFGVVK